MLGVGMLTSLTASKQRMCMPLPARRVRVGVGGEGCNCGALLGEGYDQPSGGGWRDGHACTSQGLALAAAKEPPEWAVNSCHAPQHAPYYVPALCNAPRRKNQPSSGSPCGPMTWWLRKSVSLYFPSRQQGPRESVKMKKCLLPFVA